MKNFNNFLTESKITLVQEKLQYSMTALEPVTSRATLDYHFNGLASKYVERYNKGEGDPDFNFAGAVLHNIFFAQFTEPFKSKFGGTIKEKIEAKYSSLANLQDEIEKVAMKIQGSGWIYLDDKLNIKIIHNHEYNSNMKIVLLIDWWEHAWALDYKADKKKYLKTIYNIIDWTVISNRLIPMLKEESEVDAMPTGDEAKVTNPLKNPANLFNDFPEAQQAATKISMTKTAPDDRAYILHYKHASQSGTKPFVVVYNKTLLSQAPDWEQHGYLIKGWVSQKDGKVIRTDDGQYVKDDNDQGREYTR